MLFSSLTFLAYFLPAVVLLHLLAPARARNALLLAASVVFYAWGEIGYLPLVLLSMGVNWLLGRGAAGERQAVRRFALAASLLFNLGALFYFKYAAFFMDLAGLSAYAPQPSLPLGISFYTFQTQAYVVDVYRRKVPPERNFIDYATFILLFPQLIAGPIVLYEDVRERLKARSVSAGALEEGMCAFVTGLAAKVLLANPLGALWERMRALPDASMGAAWLGIAAFGLQIYFDFHGYSLMAIGMGRMFGFTFPRNFHHPYAAASVRAFWRRWHMTLGAWFREYVYLPLGGSRGGTAKTVRNLFIVWLLTGLWHGASVNFVLWGLWYFLLLALEHFFTGSFLARHKGLGHVYTLLAVLLGWVLFATDTPAEAAAFLQRMFTPLGGSGALYALRENAVLLSIAALCCIPGVCTSAQAKLSACPPVRAALFIGVLLLCIAALVAEDYNPFLYFRF
ncbi:MAG TPA: MBOAT family protein [Candidatus Aphodomonas merdavium]|nr:MBOAT family protein [Candidatus Aphodomonas merdavium]